jgi:hypothetical protein
MINPEKVAIPVLELLAAVVPPETEHPAPDTDAVTVTDCPVSAVPALFKT